MWSLFVPCISDHYSKSMNASFVVSQSCPNVLFPHTEKVRTELLGCLGCLGESELMRGRMRYVGLS